MWTQECIEEIRLKKYLANNKGFDLHVSYSVLNQQKDFWCSLFISIIIKK